MGVPVVVVPSGGVPVKPVDSGAPNMQVATNGFGMPITYSDLGAPFIVTGGNGPQPSFNPLDLFEGGAYTGRLYDFKQSRMWSDDGVTLATAGQSVQRIEDLTGAGDATQATSSFRGILQDDGTVLTDGLDDWYDTGMNMTNDGTIQLYALVDVLGPLTAIGCFVGARTSDTARNFIYVQNNRPIVVIGGTSWDYLSDGPLVGTTCGLGQGSSQSTRVVHLNGQLMTGLKPNLVARGTSKIYIGAVPGSPPTGYAQIRLRLALVINRLLTDAEAAQLQAYGTS